MIPFLFNWKLGNLFQSQWTLVIYFSISLILSFAQTQFRQISNTSNDNVEYSSANVHSESLMLEIEFLREQNKEMAEALKLKEAELIQENKQVQLKACFIHEC